MELTQVFDTFFDELLDPRADRRLHSAAGEVFIAVRTAEVAVLGCEQDQLQNFIAVVLLAEGELNLPVLVRTVLDHEAPVHQILEHSLEIAPGPGFAEELFYGG